MQKKGANQKKSNSSLKSSAHGSELVFSFDIHMNDEAVPTPTLFQVHEPLSDLSNRVRPKSEFKYLNDSLCGVAYHGATDFTLLNLQNRELTKSYFLQTDPYLQLFTRSEYHLKSKLGSHLAPMKNKELELTYAKQFESSLRAIFSNRKLQLKDLSQITDLIQKLESDLGKPLIYNFALNLGDQLTTSLVAVYSFLFHLRTLSVSFFNEHSQDRCFDLLRCDSISDYLPKSDFTANDALLFWQFKKLSTPFIGVQDRDSRIENLMIRPMLRAFENYSHNAFALIHQIPESYLTQLSLPKLEQELFSIQMNWLLGTHAGLLYRIREEIAGLERGYSDLFWPDAQPLDLDSKKSLSFDVRITEQKIEKKAA